MLTAICFNLDQPKTLSSGNGLKQRIYIPGASDYVPNNKIMALIKLKAFADDKFTFAKTIIYAFDRVKKHGKRRKC